MTNKVQQSLTADWDEQAEPARVAPALPAAQKNYITLAGYQGLRQELLALIDHERPKIVEVVHWAASNGDRSENGDYIYGKKRLREIDRRIRWLTQRLEIAEVVDPSLHFGKTQIFFGATVTYRTDNAAEQTVTILGIDEARSAEQQVSWVAPIAKTLLKARLGDWLWLNTPAGPVEIEVTAVHYPAPSSIAVL